MKSQSVSYFRVLLPLTLFSVSLFLSGCSYFGDGAIRSSAEVISMEKLKAVLKTEVNATISPNHPRANDFIVFVLQNTKAEPESIVEITAEQRQVKMKVRTVSPEARQMLLEIVGKLEGKKANAFNFTDALGMIKLQKGSANLFVDQNFTLTLHKNSYRWVEQ